MPRRVKCPTAPPTKSVAAPAKPIDHHITLPVEVTIHGKSGNERDRREEEKRRGRGGPGRAGGRGIDAQLFARVRAKRQVRVPHEVDRETLREIFVDPASQKEIT